MENLLHTQQSETNWAMCKAIRAKVEEQYQHRLRTGETKKISISELRVLMAKALDAAWKKLCKGSMMETAFSDVGLSLNIDGSEDNRMKFQGQPPGRPV